jgi:hypothetical protein
MEGLYDYYKYTHKVTVYSAVTCALKAVTVSQSASQGVISRKAANRGCFFVSSSPTRKVAMTNTDTQNPWHGLKPLYVLPEDFAEIAHHKNYSNLRLDTLPDQVIGGLDKAEVVFLLLNPGFDNKDITVNLTLPHFIEANRRNSTDPFGSPFYYFGGDLERTGGYIWWRRILNPLIEAGVTEATLRDKIMAIEYFPYHSKSYKNLPPVPSQQYAFDLVNEAIGRRKTIVIMRSKDLWFGAVPPLEGYMGKMIIKNPRNPSVSPKNLGEDNFNMLLSKLQLTTPIIQAEA